MPDPRTTAVFGDLQPLPADAPDPRTTQLFNPARDQARQSAAILHEQMAREFVKPENAGRPAPIGQKTPLLTTAQDGTYSVTGGDEGASRMARWAADQYQDQLRQQAPAISDQHENLTKQFQDDLEQRYRAFQLETLAQSQLNTGQAGFGSPTWGLRNLPVAHYFTDPTWRGEVADAAERWNKGEATAMDYGWLANARAEMIRNGQMGMGEHLMDKLVKLGGTASEWILMGQLPGFAQAGALTSPAARLGALAGVRTGYQGAAEVAGNVLGSGRLREAALPEGVGVDQYGMLKMQPGTQPNVFAEGASKFIENSLFEGLGVFGSKAGKSVGRSLVEMLGAGELSSVSRQLLRVAPEGGNLWQLGQAITEKDPEKRWRAVQGLLTDAGAALILTGLSHAVETHERSGMAGPSVEQTTESLLRQLSTNADWKLRDQQPGGPTPTAPYQSVSEPPGAPGTAPEAPPSPPGTPPAPEPPPGQPAAPAAAQAAPAAVPEAPAAPQTPFESLSDADLRKTAKDLGIKGAGMLSRAKIMTELGKLGMLHGGWEETGRAVQPAPQPPPEPPPAGPATAVQPAPAASSEKVPGTTRLLRIVDEGRTPAFITRNLRLIAEGWGVEIGKEDTPNAVIEKIRKAATPEAPPAAEAPAGQPSPVATGETPPSPTPPPAPVGPAAEASSAPTGGGVGDLQSAMDAKGLTPREQHIMRERLNGRSLEAIISDPEMGGTVGVREAVRKIEKKAMAKLGANFSMEDFNAEQRAAEKPEDQLAAREVGYRQPISAEEKAAIKRAKAPLDPHERASRGADSLADQILKEAENGSLAPDWLERYAAASRTITEKLGRANTAAGKARGLPGQAEGPQRGTNEPASVRRAGTGQPSAEPAEAGPANEATPGSAAGSAGAAAVPEAADRELERQFQQEGRQRYAEALGRYEQLRDARNQALETMRKLGAKGLGAIKGKIAKGNVDPNSLKGFDAAVDYLIAHRPELFGESHGRVQEGLMSLLETPPERPTLQEHYHAVAEEYHAGQHEAVRQELLRRGANAGAVEHASDLGEQEGVSWAEEEDGPSGAAAELGGTGSPGSFNFGGSADVHPDTQRALDELSRGPGVSEFLSGEAGAAVPEKLLEAAAKTKVRLVEAFNYARDSFWQMGGRQLQDVARGSDATAREMRRYLGTGEEVPLVAEDMTEKVWGSVPPADRQRFLQAHQELRFREIQEKAYDRSRAAIAAARQAKDPAEAAKLSRESADLAEYAANVTTHVGKGQLPDEAAFQDTVNDPAFNAYRQRYRDNYVPFTNEGYRVSQGLEETDPINSWTQMKGEPINLVRGDPEKPTPTTVPGTAQGNLKNLRLRKSPYANEASLSSSYETDPATVMRENVNTVLRSRNKASMFRTAIAVGEGEFGRPGTGNDRELKGEKVREIPFVLQGKNPFAEPGETSFYVPESRYNDWRRTLAVDAPYAPELAKAFNDIATRSNLISTLELAAHTKNIGTGLMTGGVSLGDVVKRTGQVLRGDPEIRQTLIELAQANALRPEQAVKGVAPFLGKWDPTTWGQRFIHALDRGGRLVASDAFDRLVKAGVYKDFPNSRGDFVNGVMGNYDKRTQPEWQAVLRNWGLQPFAVAAGTFAVSGIRQTAGLAPASPLSGKAQARYSAESLARVYGTLAVIPLLNYLAWGNAAGDDKTPLGNLKIAETADGRSSSLPLANIFTGVPRAMRQVGLLAFIEGQRAGASTSASLDRARDQSVSSLIHLAFGPGPEFAKVATTGKSLTGFPIAAKARGGSSQAVEDLKAAFEGANPLVGSALGVGEKPRTPTLERITKLAGPFAPQQRGAPIGYFRRR